LFDETWRFQPIRYLGVRVSDFCSNDFVQISLFDGKREKYKSLDQTIDSIRTRFCNRSVIRSTFLHSGLRWNQMTVLSIQLKLNLSPLFHKSLLHFAPKPIGARNNATKKICQTVSGFYNSCSMPLPLIRCYDV